MTVGIMKEYVTVGFMREYVIVGLLWVGIMRVSTSIIVVLKQPLSFIFFCYLPSM